MLTGLDIEAKADLAGRSWRTWTRRGRWPAPTTPTPTCRRRPPRCCTAWCAARPEGHRPGVLRRRHRARAVELPRLHVTAPPGEASPYGVFTAAFVDAAEVTHVAVLPDGARVDIARTGDAGAGGGARSCPAGASAPRRRSGRRSVGSSAPAAATRADRRTSGSGPAATTPSPGSPHAGRRAVQGAAAGDGRAGRGPARSAQPARGELRRRGPPRRGRRLQRPARPPGEGARRMAPLADRRRPGRSACCDFFFFFFLKKNYTTPSRPRARRPAGHGPCFVTWDELPYL